MKTQLIFSNVRFGSVAAVTLILAQCPLAGVKRTVAILWIGDVCSFNSECLLCSIAVIQQAWIRRFSMAAFGQKRTFLVVLNRGRSRWEIIGYVVLGLFHHS
jgi:hypothetical protein